MKKSLSAWVIAATLGLTAGHANAVVVDFTSNYAGSVDWLGAGVATTFNASVPGFGGPGLDITLTAIGGGILNADSVNIDPPCGGLACDHDGIGISPIGANDDEVTIGTGEKLVVEFSEFVDITNIGFLDLFSPDASSGPTETAAWTAVSFSPDATGTLDGTEAFGATAGFAQTDDTVLIENLKKITFYATGPSNSDFALAFLDVRFTLGNIPPVPIPAALPLFAGGIGFLGLLGWRRKRSNAAA